MSLPLLLALPWLAVCAAIALRFRPPPHLPDVDPGAATGRDPGKGDGDRLPSGGDALPSGGKEEGRASRDAEGGNRPPPPLVSIVVPARDEADVIERCLTSLARSRHPSFEVIVVDDRSRDRTGELARGVEPGNARRVLVLEGKPLPDEWLGKPWACWQGYQEARGELLLFIDADTRHGPELLARAVRALDEAGAGALSAGGRQVMEHWWEKVVLPQVFTLISIRFPDPGRPVEEGRCRDALATGQFILVRREAYEASGGHRAVRGEVVEDLQLARALCRSGARLVFRDAGDDLATRMYRSFGQMLQGWTKNLAIGTLQTLPRGTGRWALPGGFLLGIALWLLPPLALGAGIAGAAPGPVTVWAGAVVAVSTLFWGAASARTGVNPLYGLLYPVGSALTSMIFARSVLRGGRVEWKGRTYRLDGDRFWNG